MELGGGEEAVLVFEGGGEEVEGPEGGRGVLTDEQIAVVVGTGGGERVAGSVIEEERRELRCWEAGGVSTGLQYFHSTVFASLALPQTLSAVTSLAHVGLTLSLDSQIYKVSCRHSINSERFPST